MERIDYLNQHGTRIIQSDDVFAYSTDALLLSHFTWLPKNGNIVDLCAGNGAIGLNIAHKTQAKITLIEIQERLADMARRSIQLNHLENQVNVIQAPLNQSLDFIKADSVDAITCNPPYFKTHPNSKTNPNPHLALARHELMTNLDEIIQISHQLLKTKGHLSMVHRPDRLLDILSAMQKTSIVPKRLQFVYPSTNKPANMILIEGIKQGKTEGFKVLPPFIMYDEHHHYTAEMDVIVHG